VTNVLFNTFNNYFSNSIIMNLLNTIKFICLLLILSNFVIVLVNKETMTNKDLHNPIKKANCKLEEDYIMKDCILCDNSCLQ
jgi:hypothetical protein